MSEAKHTPAWEVCNPGDYADYAGRSIVILSGDSKIIVVLGDDKKAVAIAHLIAAAPEMLEALKWAATVIRPGSDLRDSIDAAIAKAEGRS